MVLLAIVVWMPLFVATIVLGLVGDRFARHASPARRLTIGCLMGAVVGVVIALVEQRYRTGSYLEVREIDNVIAMVVVGAATGLFHAWITRMRHVPR